jgi:transposase
MTRQKRKKAKSKQVFKPYQQQQGMLLPPNLEELIPENHLVRVVNGTIDGLNLEPLLATYRGGGTSAYHPMLLLKVLVYAYVMKIYSSRKIAKALREDVNFMWLSGMSRPDFRTINLFRSSRLKEVIDRVFGSMVFFLEAHGYVDLNEYFIDGTKIEADSNRHKAVWAKNTKRYKEKTQQKLRELLRHIEQENEKENKRYGEKDLAEMGNESTLTSEDVKEQISRLKEIVEGTAAKKETTRTIKTIEKDLLPKLERYEQQEKPLKGRNSYAKTDTDATMFRMKDERLLPAYNLLMGTQHQFILGYSFHQQKASEADAFCAHMERFQQMSGHFPFCVVGDSGYGSQENYTFLEEHHIDNYLKYNTFHYEQKKKFRDDAYRKDNFSYDPSSDTYSCPQGRTMILKEINTDETSNGYPVTNRLYQCEDCRDCPVAAMCKRGQGNRTIQINPTLQAYRAQARENLTSKRGLALRGQRNCDVEPVFGDLKHNQGYQRYRLRGLPKVNIETALLSMAHNMKKIVFWALAMSVSESSLASVYGKSSLCSLSFYYPFTFWTPSRPAPQCFYAWVRSK